MRSFNLKNLLLTSSAMILTLFILIFPIYLIATYLNHEVVATNVLLILTLAAGIFTHCTIRCETFATLLLKLSLFSLTYLLVVNAFIHADQFSHYSFQLISAVYFSLLVMIFNNPYIRIMTLTTALLFAGSCLNSLMAFEHLTNNAAYVISLGSLIILGFSNYALRIYTLLIALSLTLVIWPLSNYIIHYFPVNQPSNIVTLIVVCGSFVPYLQKNFAKSSQHTKLIYGASLIGLMLALCLLPVSISAGVIMITLGLYLQSRTLYLLGIILLTTSLYFYYYNLNLTLNMKGFLLIGMGIGILLIHKIFQFLGSKHS